MFAIRNVSGRPLGVPDSGMSILMAGAFALLVASGYSAQVLDQIHHSSGDDFSLLPNPSPSQVFTDAADSSSLVLDDFTVSGSELKLTRVSGVFLSLAGFGVFQDVASYRVSIFDDINLAAGTLDGNIANLLIAAGSGITVTQLIDGSGTHDYGRVDIDLDLDLPAAGQYWLGIAPVRDSAEQFFLQSAGPPLSGGLNARFANPGEGFGAGALSIINQDAAYAVTAVPEPAAWMPLIMWGGVACILSRRRRDRLPRGKIPD